MMWTILGAAAMMLLGTASHFLKKVVEVRRAGETVSLVGYWRGHPYESMLSVIGAIVGLVVLHQMGELTLLTAYGTGYVANSMSEAIGDRTKSLINDR